MEFTTQSENYRNMPGISQSMIKAWRYEPTPKWYKKYILKEESTGRNEDTFMMGTLMDLVLYSPELLPSMIYIGEEILPSDSIKEIIHIIYGHVQREKSILALSKDSLPQDYTVSECLNDYRELILKTCEELNIYSSFKEDTRVNKVIKEGMEYFNQLLVSDGRKIIPNRLLMAVLEMAEIVKEDSNTQKYFTNNEVFENIFQLELNRDIIIKDLEGIIKGAIDTLHIDHSNKTYRIVDFKTSANAYDFKRSIKKFGYAEQVSFYQFLIEDYIKERKDLKGYQQQPPINIVIDKDYKVPLIYQYSQKDLDLCRVGNGEFLSKLYKTSDHNDIVRPGWEETLYEIFYCLKHDVWTMPYKMITEGHIPVNLRND